MSMLREPTPWAMALLRSVDAEYACWPSSAVVETPQKFKNAACLLDIAREDGVRTGLAVAIGLLTVGDDIPREGNIIASDRDLTIRVLQSFDAARVLANYDRKNP